MLDLVRATIRKYVMFAPGDRILLGVSGGPDSVALAHILRELAAEMQVDLFIAHLNHNLRGQESAADAEFVQRFADRLGLPAVIETRDAGRYAADNNMSTQAAAREVRYRFFADAARNLGCNKLATGHNANDQAETVLFNFLRGSGLAGLAGISPVRDGWVTRPLIEASRAQVDEYCRENKLETRLDSSNLKVVYTRNKIRLELIPLLEREYNARMVETLVRTSEIMRDEEQYLDQLTDDKWEYTVFGEDDNLIRFDLGKFLELPAALQRRVIRRAWTRLTGSGRNLEFVHLNGIFDMLKNARSGSVLNLPMEVSLCKYYREFSLVRSPAPAPTVAYEYKLEIPGITVVPETGVAIAAEIADRITEPARADEIFIDVAEIKLPIRVRSRRPGDWFRPFGLKGSTKVKKFFIDRKIPRSERERVPVLVTADEQIIWLAGLRADRRWQATPESKVVLKLKIIRNLPKPN